MSVVVEQLKFLPRVWIPVLVICCFTGWLGWLLRKNNWQGEKDAFAQREALWRDEQAKFERSIGELERKIAEREQLTSADAVSKTASKIDVPWLHLELTPQEKLLVDPDRSHREFIAIAPIDLRREAGRGTTAQGHLRIQPYIGKWMRVGGTLADVLEPLRGAYTAWIASKGLPQFDAPGVILSDVIARFDDEPKQLLVKNRGEDVTIEGMILGVTNDAVQLIHCTIVDDTSRAT